MVVTFYDGGNQNFNDRMCLYIYYFITLYLKFEKKEKSHWIRDKMRIKLKPRNWYLEYNYMII